MILSVYGCCSRNRFRSSARRRLGTYFAHCGQGGPSRFGRIRPSCTAPAAGACCTLYSTCCWRLLTFKRTKGEANAAFRADLLAGIAWIHLHHADLRAVLKRISADHLSRLALVLGLDVAADGLLAHWPQLLARRVFSRSVLGSTPVKRKAVNVEAEDQIRKPHASQLEDRVEHSLAGEKKQSLDKQSKRLKSGKKAPAVSSRGGDSASGSASASDSSSDGSVVVIMMETLPTELMPAQLGNGQLWTRLRRFGGDDLRSEVAPDRHNRAGYSCAI